MANTFRQPTQSDLDREQFHLGLASAQSKAYTQSQANASQSAPEPDYTTAPDRISLYDLNKLNQSIASGIPKSDTPVLDFWKQQQAAKSAAGTDYTTAPDRISFNDLRQMDKTTASGASKSDTPVLDFWKRQQAAKSAANADYTTAPDRVSLNDLNKLNQSVASGASQSAGPVLDLWKRQQAAKSASGTDYTYALDRVPFTQANPWAGSNATGSKATNLSSAGQSAPWLNTPLYGDDGALLSGTLAQTGNSGYDGGAAQDELYQPDRTSFTSVNLPNLGEDMQAEYGRRLTRSLTDGAYQAQQDLAALRGGTSSRFSDTRYLTAAERSMILAYADRGEYAAAMSYYDSLKDSLAQRTGRQIADSIGSMENPVLKDLMAVGLGMDEGLNRSVGGLLQAGSRLLGSDAPVAQSPSVYANRIVRPQLTGFAGAASDVASSVGFMLPSFALGAATGMSGLGSVMLGLSSAGDTYNRERNAGKDDMEAFVYASAVGALEGGLQYMLGGIGALGKGGVSKFLAETPAARAAVTKVDDALQLLAQSETAQDLLAAAAEAGGFALRMNDQGMEEWLQANLEPVIRNVVFGEDNQFQPFSSDKLYSYLLGALTAGLYNLYYDNFIERGSTESTKAQFEKDFEEGWNEGGYEDEAVTKGKDNTKKIPKASELKNSQTVQDKMSEFVKKGRYKGEVARPYIDSNGTNSLVDEIMNGGIPVKDSLLINGLRWDVPGYFRGSEGIWELVVNLDTNTIVHFNFVGN